MLPPPLPSGLGASEDSRLRSWFDLSTNFKQVDTLRLLISNFQLVRIQEATRSRKSKWQLWKYIFAHTSCEILSQYCGLLLNTRWNMEIEDAEEKKSFFNPGELFSAHLTYLAHTVPALNWMASHQPAEVITVWQFCWCRLRRQQWWSFDWSAHPATVRGGTPTCCRSSDRRQQQLHTSKYHEIGKYAWFIVVGGVRDIYM